MRQPINKSKTSETRSKQAEEELQKHRDHLEELVEERTAELMKINEQLQQEIAERKKAEETLRESEEKLRVMFKSIRDALIIVDLEWRVVEVNEAGLLISGYRKEEVVGRSIFDFIAEEYHARATEDMKKTFEAGRTTKHVEYAIQDVDGREIEAEFGGAVLRDDSGNPTGFIAVVRDITERKKAEEERERLIDELEKANKDLKDARDELVETLIQSRKMSAIGQLAGGVAHEINNPLTGVLTYATRLLEKSEDPELLKINAFEVFPEDLKIIEEAALRCKKITSDLLSFTRRTKLEMNSLNINEVMQKTLTLVRHQLELQKIDIVTNLQPDPPLILGSADELEQVFTNIILNAQHAMPEGGTLTISTNATKDKTVEITIADTGKGIPRENLGKIFDPFYTTMPPGKGTGLGLSISYGIIQEHKGLIDVESKLGTGTAFEITLPVLDLGRKLEWLKKS